MSRLLIGDWRFVIPSAETQPIVSEDGQTVLVYNGELYNDRELRTELQKYGVKFQTRCDTETLLAAWSTWGVDCLQKLKGMFAFGVYDFAENRLFLVRDRFGVKPLFFAEVAGELVFSQYGRCSAGASSYRSTAELVDHQPLPDDLPHDHGT